MMRKFKLILIIIGMMATSMQAQDDTLSLQRAVTVAAENNPGINKLKARIAEKKEQWRIYSGIDSPEFNYTREGINKDENQSFDEQRLSIKQSFDFPLTTVYRMQALKRELGAMELELQAKMRDLKAMVKQQYVEVLYSLYNIRLVHQKIELADQLYNAAFSREESGEGNGMEVLNAEIRQAEARNDLDDAQAMLHRARYGLFNLLGLPIEEQKYSLRFADTLRTHKEVIDQRKALDFLEGQPEYRSAGMQLEAAGKRLQEARSNILPDITVGYIQQDYGNGFDFHGFELGIKLPLWIPLKHQGEVRSAKARQTRLQWEQMSVKLLMKEEIEKAWHGYENSVSTIERFDETIRSKAELLQGLTYEGYRIGEIDLLTLLDAQQTYLRSQQRYLEALRNHYIQLIDLEKYIGEDIVY